MVVPVRPSLDTGRAAAVLEAVVGPASAIEPVGSGQVSQAFTAVADGKPVVVRFNQSLEPFRKDATAAERFAGPDLPVPKVIALGETDDGLAWAVSERAPGVATDRCGRATLLRAMPAIFRSLDAIHRSDPGTGTGFGSFDADGRGEHATWRESLLSVLERTETVVEPSIHRAVARRLDSLAERCPEERTLIHGDYGFDNLLLDGPRVSAVLDWALAGYGDPLYDVAWLGWWDSNVHWIGGYRRHLSGQGRTEPDLDARLEACALHIGLGSVAYFAEKGERRLESWTAERTSALLRHGLEALVPGRGVD